MTIHIDFPKYSVYFRLNSQLIKYLYYLNYLRLDHNPKKLANP